MVVVDSVVVVVVDGSVVEVFVVWTVAVVDVVHFV